MKPGVIVKLPDGRIGTVVYNGLDGVGIKWGEHDITLDDLQGNGGCVQEDVSDDYEWEPDAMLRKPYASAELECVGEDFMIIND